MKARVLKTLALVFLAFVGCRRDASETAKGAALPPPLKSAGAASATRKAAFYSSVVVCIDGQPLTRRDVVRNGKVMLTLNMNKMRRTKIGKKDWEYLSRYCAEAAKREVGRAAVRRYLADHRLTPDSNVVARLTRAFVRRYGVKSKKLKRWHTVDDLKYMLGTNAFRVDAEIRDRVDYATVTNAILAANPVVVTEPMVQKRLKEIADYNARAEATNAVVFARATNVWQKIVGKEITFEDAAKAYSEDAYLAYGYEWGLFTREQLSDEAEVLKLLPTLKVGDVTPPVESDGGLAILRMDASDDPDNVAFSRVFFRLPMFYTQETPAEARTALKEELSRELISETLKDVASKLKIEYPDGTNVFSSAALTPAEFSACDR